MRINALDGPFAADDLAMAIDATGSRKANILLTDLRAQIVMDQMQTQFPDHDALEREATQEKRPDRIASLQMIANTCNQKAFGAPAKKLEFK